MFLFHLLFCRHPLGGLSRSEVALGHLCLILLFQILAHQLEDPFIVPSLRVQFSPIFPYKKDLQFSVVVWP